MQNTHSEKTRERWGVGQEGQWRATAGLGEAKTLSTEPLAI